MTPFHSPVIAAFRLIAFLLWTLIIVPPYALFVLPLGRYGLPAARFAACFYWRQTNRLLGIHVKVRGEASTIRPTLFIANHASYLDILVLGSLLPAVFVAKKEVSKWPGIGLLARLGRTTFIERSRGKTRDQRDQMAGRIGRDQESMILFPEGTSNDGNRVLPFKSALLSVAEMMSQDGKALPVQPISVAYTRLDNMPIRRDWRSFFSWYGDMDLAPHLWEMLGLGSLTVEVEFHPLARLEDFGSRKSLTDHCHDVISRGVIQANAGHHAPPTQV